MRYIQIDSEGTFLGEITFAPEATQETKDIVASDPYVVLIQDDEPSGFGMVYDFKTGTFDYPKPDYVSQKDIIRFIRDGVNKV